MTIVAKTDRPNGLLAAIREAIDGADESPEAINTWSHDHEGDLQHTKTENKVQAAWFRPKIFDGAIRFQLIKLEGAPPLDAFSYAYHHGKLLQMLLQHFSDRLQSVSATPWDA